MGSMKDTLGARGAWRRFTPSHRCVVCGRPKTCSVSGDGAVVWCAKVASEHHHQSGIADGWLHYLDDASRTLVKGWQLPAVPLAKRAGPVEVRDVVYRELLTLLDLTREHRAGLEARGLEREHIDAGEYRSLPPASRASVGKRLAQRFTDAQLAAVPGLFQREDGGRRWWTVGGSAGLLVPVRDLVGRIVGIKIRLDQAQSEGGRYRYLTSSSHGGAKAELVVHVPAWADAEGAAQLYVTEGELKADVSSALLGAPVIGIPGVSQWMAGRDAAIALRPRRVIVAMDMDRNNPAVAGAQEQLVKSLRAAGLSVGAASWDPTHKGLDDALLAKRKGAVAA